MFNNGNEDMHMGSFAFMGMHFFWWVSILIFALVLLVTAHRYRKRK
jgi:hypothetical protein